MARTEAPNLRALEGLQINIALRDGSRIDDCSLVSSGRNRLDTLWVFVNGDDVFIPRSDVVDVWPTHRDNPWAA